MCGVGAVGLVVALIWELARMDILTRRVAEPISGLLFWEEPREGRQGCGHQSANLD